MEERGGRRRGAGEDQWRGGMDMVGVLFDWVRSVCALFCFGVSLWSMKEGRVSNLASLTSTKDPRAPPPSSRPSASGEHLVPRL